MIAIEGYLHYYEDHQDILKDLKKEQTASWYANQHKKNRRILNQREKDLNKDLSLNFSDLQQDLSNVFNIDSLQASEVDLHGKPIRRVRSQNDFDASSASYELANRLANSNEQLTQYIKYLSEVFEIIDQIHDKLGLNQVSALLLGHKNNPDAEIANYLIPHNGKTVMIDDNSIQTLQSSYESLRIAVQGLLNFNTEMVRSKAKSETMQDLLKAVRGGLNGVKGILLEAELYEGLCKAHLDTLHILDVQMTGLKNATEKQDPNIRRDKKILEDTIKEQTIQKNNPNSDITLKVSGHGGTGYIGISVKNHHTKLENLPSEVNKYDFAQTLSLGSKSNLYEQILNAQYYLSKLTIVDPIFYGQQAFGIHRYGLKNMGARSGNAFYWESYLDAVAVLNVLDRLAGEGGYANFSRFLVMNGLLFSVDDILLQISKNPDLVYGFSIEQYIGRGINSWRDPEEKETNTDAAERRSDEVKIEMIDRWKSATLSTKINLALLAAI